jgi:hypothetical protein
MNLPSPIASKITLPSTLPQRRARSNGNRAAPISPVLEPFAKSDANAEWLSPQALRPAPISRLIVLVPSPELDETALARRIWTLALPRCLRVLYLSLGHQGELEWPMRRTLATLSALTRDSQVQVAHHVASAPDWIRAVRGVWRPGDLVICMAEQSVRRWGNYIPLGAALWTTLDVPVGVLAGLELSMPPAGRALAARLVAWAVPLSILAGFTWLQVQIVGLPDDPLRTLFLSLTVLVEFGLIGVWTHVQG